MLQNNIEVNGVNLQVTFFLEQFIHVVDEYIWSLTLLLMWLGELKKMWCLHFEPEKL